jgi:glutamate-1-semialdehyde aminotransferase
MTEAAAGINRRHLAEVIVREHANFLARIPKSRALRHRASGHMPNGVPMSWMAGLYPTPPLYAARGVGPRFWDVDGNEYLDFNLCDLSMTMGFSPAPIVEAVTRAVSTGAHFLLATQDAVPVAEELARRVGVPHWQFTLSASGANAEVVRISRVATGRPKIVIFEGHYHGHLEETLVRKDDGQSVIPDLMGILPDAVGNTVILPFNDLAALERRLQARDVALVLTEPALTNCTLVLPQPGFHDGLRALTARYGTLLCYDEAHTFQFAYGGLVSAWKLSPDFVVLGKGLGTGVSYGLYGMSGAVAEVFLRYADSDSGPKGIATGGTTYGSAIAVAAARAALEQVLTEEGYCRLESLGARLSEGLDRVFRARRLPWRAQRLGPRSGFCLSTELPDNGQQAARSLDAELINARRMYLANRGIWDAIGSAGPQVSFAHESADVDAYLGAIDGFLGEVASGA